MILLLLGFFLLSTTYIANKILLGVMPIMMLACLKLLISGVVFLGILSYKKRLRILFSKVKEDIALIGFICVVTTALPYFFKLSSLKHLVSSQSMMIGSLDPFITALFAFFLFKKRISYRKQIGIFLGVLSIATLFYYDKTFFTINGGPLYFAAIFQGILAVIIGRYGWIKTQALLIKDRYTISEINCLILLGGGAASLLSLFLFTSEEALTPITITNKHIYLLIYSAIVGNVVSYYIYSHSLKKYPVTMVSYCGLIIPFSGHFLGWFFLNEQLSKTFFVALGIICLGYLLYFVKRREKVPSEV